MLNAGRLLATCIALATSAHASTDFPFPMDVVDQATAEGVLELVPRRAEIAALAGLDAARLRGVELPGGTTVALDLERIDFDFSRVGIHVDGAFRGWGTSATDLSLWKGKVDSARDSDVWLALSSHGCYGWIRSDGRMWHLSSFATPGGDWSASHSRWIADTALDAPDFECFADRVRSFADDAAGDASGNYQGLTLECAMAVETDWQYFQHWGNLTAAETFLIALLGAVSDRFFEQINVVITYPYVMLYTSSNDPWSTQETGGDAGDLLGEFRGAWAGSIPAGAHLAHFLSGAYLGGGVAYVDVLCSSQWGFAVSAGIDGGIGFPVTQGSGNWDFMVVAHETGHQFGSPHTFNYTPPIDDCPNVCISNGTNMSYCHLCSGGTANITTYFHPRVVDRMRAEALASCLPPACSEDANAGNHSCADAIGLATGVTPGLASVQGAPDYFRAVVASGGGLRIDVLFDHGEGNIDARLFDADCGQELFASTSSTDNEAVVFNNPSGQTVAVVLAVEVVSGPCNDYTLDYLRLGPDPCDLTPDAFEENDACLFPHALQAGVHSGLNVSTSDPDYYSMTVADGGWLFVDAAFANALGNLDLYLYSPAACGGGASAAIAAAETDGDLEQLAWNNTSGGPLAVVLEVAVREDGFSECNTYALSMHAGDPGNLGQTYCSPGESSSTGFPARIRATGSPVLGDNDVTLTASVVPHGQFGYFLGSLTSAFVPTPGGSQGNLCVGGQVARFVSQTQSSGATGTLSIPVDMTAIPTSPPTAVQIGETWFFQCWFRDVNPTSTSNFTDGVSTTFLF